MPELASSNRIYARPITYAISLGRTNDQFTTGLEYSEPVAGDQFDWVIGFYISSTDFDASAIAMEYYKPFSSSAYGTHILTAYPPFSAYPLEYEVYDNNNAIVTFKNLSAFNNTALVVLNPAGYHVRYLYGDF